MLKIENLRKNFGENEVLKGLDLEVKEGSIFGLVGVNGAGKSTLLRLIAGVYRPEAGKILLDGCETWIDEKIRGKIAFVPDEQYYPFGSTIASQKLLYQSLYDFDEEIYTEYMKVFGLDEKQTLANLSKGMKRRLCLLFALCVHPKLLLLDESYDGLEPLARLRFKEILMERTEEEGLTVIISSHNLKELEDICDSFGILENGVMMSYGDLLQSKEQINKYQIVFAEEKEREDFEGFDVLHFEKEGRVCKLVIRGEESEVEKQLDAMSPVLLDVLQVNFEELFIYEMESRGEAQ